MGGSHCTADELGTVCAVRVRPEYSTGVSFPLAVEEFDFLGITEEYDRSLELFRRLLYPEGWLDVTAHHQNPNRKRKFYDIDPDLRKKILELNEQDAYTYLAGVRRLRYLFERVGL